MVLCIFYHCTLGEKVVLKWQEFLKRQKHGTEMHYVFTKQFNRRKLQFSPGELLYSARCGLIVTHNTWYERWRSCNWSPFSIQRTDGKQLSYPISPTNCGWVKITYHFLLKCIIQVDTTASGMARWAIGNYVYSHSVRIENSWLHWGNSYTTCCFFDAWIEGFYVRLLKFSRLSVSLIDLTEKKYCFCIW